MRFGEIVMIVVVIVVVVIVLVVIVVVVVVVVSVVVVLLLLVPTHDISPKGEGTYDRNARCSDRRDTMRKVE